MIESKGWILVALVFAVLMLLLNISTLEEKTPAPLFGKETEEKFDYQMQQMVVQQYDNEGKLTSTLSADSLVHFPGKQLISLSNPSLLFTASNQNWILDAARGTLSELSEELNLTTLVSIKNIVDESKPSTNPFNSSSIHIEVNQLIYNLQQQLAYSPNQVKMTSDKWQLKGEGLSIDLNSQTLKILNKVEAIHEIH